MQSGAVSGLLLGVSFRVDRQGVGEAAAAAVVRFRLMNAPGCVLGGKTSQFQNKAPQFATTLGPLIACYLSFGPIKMLPEVYSFVIITTYVRILPIRLLDMYSLSI